VKSTDIIYTDSIRDIDWHALKARLREDDFDNGRSADQLRESFANSYAVCFARCDGAVIGKGRVLSDGVCNAYLVDLWTHTPHRHHGIAREIVRRLSEKLQGQHISLQADADVAGFYRKLGFVDQPHGLSRVVGKWLTRR